MIKLKVGSQLFEGWKRVEISRGLDRVAGSFRLSVSDKPWPIRPGDRAEVTIDGETVITGWVDAVRISHDATRHDIEVAGRSLTGDLVDCSADHSPGQWTGQKIERIAAALAKPFGVEVVAQTDTGAALGFFRIDPASTAHSEIERLCRTRGVLATDDERGRLLITRAGTDLAPAALTRPGNVLAAEGAFTMNERFSRYTIKSQVQGTEEVVGAQATAIKSVATDPGVGRFRPLVVVSSAPVDAGGARDRARHEAAVRFGRAATVNVTTSGWRANGALWRPNKVVRYRDEWLRLDREMLIASVTLSLDDQGGELARMLLVRPDAYRLLPESEVEAAGDPWALVEPAQPQTGIGSQ